MQNAESCSRFKRTFLCLLILPIFAVHFHIPCIPDMDMVRLSKKLHLKCDATEMWAVQGRKTIELISANAYVFLVITGGPCTPLTPIEKQAHKFPADANA